MIEVDRVAVGALADLRAAFREAAGCQIVRDSILPRGLADAYALRADGLLVGYGSVWNRHFPGRVMEFHVTPAARADAAALFGALVAASGATHVETQTNLELMSEMFRAHTEEVIVENVLYAEGRGTTLQCPTVTIRPRAATDVGPDGDWVAVRDGAIVGAGGVLRHYNPPYGDLYMEVVPEARRQGIGSYLVQELRAVCRRDGVIPAARCDPDNEASRRALEKGGLVRCGELLAGEIRPPS